MRSFFAATRRWILNIGKRNNRTPPVSIELLCGNPAHTETCIVVSQYAEIEIIPQTVENGQFIIGDMD